MTLAPNAAFATEEPRLPKTLRSTPAWSGQSASHMPDERCRKFHKTVGQSAFVNSPPANRKKGWQAAGNLLTPTTVF